MLDSAQGEADSVKTVWPAHGLSDAETVLADDDEIVFSGCDARGAGVIVSMRDLGADVSAGFWDDELERIAQVSHPSAARFVNARVVTDRFFVITTERSPGTLLRARIASGPLLSHEAGALLMAALDVATTMHDLGLSASGSRFRSAIFDNTDARRPTCVISTYGLHVDNDIENYNELREISLRVLSLVGGRYDRASGVVLPVRALSLDLERVLRQGVGLEGTPFASPLEMAAAVAKAFGEEKPRGATRSQVRTRPMTATSAPILGSNLLLAEEYLASMPRNSQDA